MKIFIYTIFIFLSAFAQAQSINGKIQFDDAYYNTEYLGDITIQNTTTKISTTTNNTGNYTIQAKVGDQLQISSPNIISRTIKVRNRAFEPNFIIYVEPNYIQLNEVRVGKLDRYLNQELFKKEEEIDNLYASLGLDPKVRYQEPKKDVSSFKATDILNVGRLYGHISGKNKEERKLREIESKINTYESIEALFEEEFYTQELKIPAYKINEFIRWTNSKTNLTNLYQDSNREMIRELLIQNSKEYLKLIH